MLWFVAFVILFSIGGMGGVLMAVPPADFQIHNSLFLIAHFHTMIIPGVLFGIFAGLTYWFPKITGYILDEKWGRYAWFFWTIGFILAFMPLYALGFMGATRRLDHYDSSTGWYPLFVVAALGAALITIGVLCQCIQCYLTYKHRKTVRDLTGDPWDGRTLEWMIPSPPPLYNFASLPIVEGRDPFWEKKRTHTPTSAHYEEIHLPHNTSLGFFLSLFAALGCFGVIWYMWWLAGVGLVGTMACIILRLFDFHPEYALSAEEVRLIEERGRFS
jgi:cytochrome o ubiquinol oxidase subunit 1